MKTYKEENDALIVEGSEEAGCRLVLKIQIKPPHTQKLYRKAIKKVNKGISIPGFRKGRAPDETVISRYGSYVDQEWKELVINEAYKGGMELVKVYPLRKESIEKPKIDHCSLEEGAAVSLAYEFYPDVPTIDFSQVTIPSIEKASVTEERITEVLESIQKAHAKKEEVSDRAVQEGDYTIVTLEALDQDPPQLIVKERSLEVSAKVMAPWLHELVLGKKGGDISEGETTVDPKADDKTKENFKPAKVRVTLHRIEKSILPPIDDALAKEAGAESKQDLHDKISEDLEKEAVEEQKNKQYLALEEALLEKYPFDLPASVEAQEIRETIKAKIEELKKENVSDEEIKKREREIEEEAQREGAKSLRIFFLGKRIAKQGNVTVTNQELNDEVSTFFARNRMLFGKDIDKETTQRVVSRIASSIEQRKIKEYALSQVNT